MSEAQAIEVLDKLTFLVDCHQEILVMLTGYLQVLVPGAVFLVLAWWLLKQFIVGR